MVVSDQGRLTDEATRKFVGDLLTALATADQRLVKSAPR